MPFDAHQHARAIALAVKLDQARPDHVQMESSERVKMLENNDIERVA